MMNLIVWLVIGTLAGWLAGQVLNNHAGTPFYIVVGIIGAMIGGVLISYGTITQDVFNLTAILVAFIGAVVLLATVTLVRRIRAQAH